MWHWNAWPNKFHLKEALAPRAELTSVLSIDLDENAPVLLSRLRKTHGDVCRMSVWGQKLAHIVVVLYLFLHLWLFFMHQLPNPSRQRETSKMMQSVELSPWTNLKCILLAQVWIQVHLCVALMAHWAVVAGVKSFNGVFIFWQSGSVIGTVLHQTEYNELSMNGSDSNSRLQKIAEY